jgi:hypothetical protein
LVEGSRTKEDAMTDQQYRFRYKQGEFELDVEGDRAFVETYVEAFLADESYLGLEEEMAAGKGRGKHAKAAPQIKTKDADDAVDGEALKAFMKGRKGLSNKQRYLEYMRFWMSRGVKEVGDGHIQACFQAEGLKIPPTGRQNFGSLRSDGLVMAGSGRGLWALTPAAAGGIAPGAARPKKAAAKVKAKPQAKPQAKAKSRRKVARRRSAKPAASSRTA